MTALFEKITEPIPTQEQENFIHSIAMENSSILAVYEAITADQELGLEQEESPQIKF